LPKTPGLIKARDYDLVKARKSYIKNAITNTGITNPDERDIQFLAEDANTDVAFVKEFISTL